MSLHPFLDDELRDRAAQYVLGTLSETESRAVRSHLAECGTCRAEVDALTRVGRELCSIAPETAPPPELWSRIAARIEALDSPAAQETRGAPKDSAGRSRETAVGREARGGDRESDRDAMALGSEVQVWKGWARAQNASERAQLATPFTFVPENAGEWQATSVAGIEARQLYVDATQDRATFLVRMAAGTSYPAHVHGGPEECFVVQGDLKVGDLIMKAGDYQRAEPGSTHGVQSTERGCVLLLVSSLSDEIVG
jgi:anti-sigma factor ChrR (cupin superfamily)